MATTQPSPTGLPGKRYSFVAKTEAPTSGPHTGLFTELSPLATPGQRRSFSAKTPATGKGVGTFTALSVMGLPGGIRTFSAKTAVLVGSSSDDYGTGGAGRYGWDGLSHRTYYDEPRFNIEEENELMELAHIIVTSGILN